MTHTPAQQFAHHVRDCANRLGKDAPGALEELYDLTMPRLYRYAMTLARNHSDAEDALQAAMLTVTAHPETLARARHPWAYFLRMVRNEVIRLSRQNRALKYVTTLVHFWQEEVVPFDRSDAREAIQAALKRLPSQQAEVVVLKVWEEMTFQEIAHVLEESPNTVASRYRYALEKLTSLLQPFACEVIDERIR